MSEKNDLEKKMKKGLTFKERQRYVELYFGYGFEGSGSLGELADAIRSLGVVCHFDNEGRYAGCEISGVDRNGDIVCQEVMERMGKAMSMLNRLAEVGKSN